MKRAKHGFTIVELLMVIAVLGVLTGIVTAAASAAIKQMRVRRADAMCMAIQSGIATYRTQEDEWPSSRLKDWCQNGLSDSRKHVAYLDESDYDEAMRTIVTESVRSGSANPVLDVSGLFVATTQAAGSKNGRGVDFREAVKKGSKRKIPLAQMVFGYPDPGSGNFRRYVIQYNADSDHVTVMTQSRYRDLTHLEWPNKP